MALCDTVTGGCALRRAGPPRVGPRALALAEIVPPLLMDPPDPPIPIRRSRSVAPDVTLYLLRLVIGIA
jgi:hypothetical protein